MSLFSIIKAYNKARKPPACTAVIAAAGSSQRCKGEDKLFYLINDKPVLAYTVDVFQQCDNINEIIIVAQESRFEDITAICSKYKFNKVSGIIKGGETRPQSVLNGIYAASKKTTHVAIHDGARPFITDEILKHTIKKASKYHAAAPGVPVASTLKKAESGIIKETVSRDGLYEIQTPQIFRIEILKAALIKAMKNSREITDDCMAVEALGVSIYITEGSRTNIKITDKDDLYIAEALLMKENC